MKLIYQYFFRGLLAALPLGLTIYLLYLFLGKAEGRAVTSRPLRKALRNPGPCL